MSVLLFPGQGSQVVGMGSEFYNNFDLVKKYLNKQMKIKFSIKNYIKDAEQLQLTKNTQPAILTVSYSIFKVLVEEFDFNFKNSKYFAGHSLGEYSALVCSNSLNFEDALYLLHERGKAMQESVPVGQGGMLAVLGLKTKEINSFIIENNFKGVCEIANDNAEGQVIVSGNIECIKSLQVSLKEKKVKSIPLKVSAPFHCSLMKTAAHKMKDKINNTHFNDSLNQIINNVTAKPENSASKIKELLVEQIYSAVRWRESIIFMSKTGEKNYVEIGPGKVLSGMVKRTINEANCFSINSIADIKNLKNELKK